VFTTVWEYEVAVERRDEFVEIYGPTGDWVALFRGAAGYRETILLQDVAHAERFVTLDRWDSRAAYEAFRAAHEAAYAALDERTQGLTRGERHLGGFVS
jgi:heme-degrading monooxygenase HmoA